jgi:hypothetical protein
MPVSRVIFALVAAGFLVGVSVSGQQAPSRTGAKSAGPAANVAAMTNADVVALVKAGFSDDLVVARIQKASNQAFDVSTDGMLSLKSSGVSQRLITVLLTGVDPGSLPTTGTASSSALVSAPAPVAVLTIPAGTEIKLRLEKTISSADAMGGELVSLVAADDVVISGEIAIKKDSPAWGKITNVTAQRLTRAGALEFSFDSVKAVNSTDIKLSGSHSAQAARGLVTGNELVLESGIVVTAKVEGDQTISISAAAKRPQNATAPFAESSTEPAPTRSSPRSTTSIEGREAGIYFKDGEKMIQLEPSVFSGGKTGNLMMTGLTYGIKKAKWKAIVRSARAAMRIHNRNPEFYFYFEPRGPGLGNAGAFVSFGASSPNEFVLAKMDRGSKERQLTVGEFGMFGSSSGTSAHDTIDLTVEKLGPGAYKVSAKEPLKGGEEYCFFYAAGASTFAAAGFGKLFDFGID